MRIVLSKQFFRSCFFIACCSFVVLLSGFRSGPVYGKLDFILLDSRPWWPEWQTMITSVLQHGDQPVFTDMITGTVLRAVFNQKTISFRNDRRYARIDVENALAVNSEILELLPVGALLVLLDDESISTVERDERPDVRNTSFKHMMLEIARGTLEQTETEERKYRYRCVINLHGFTHSWVPRETGHWSWKWAEPSLLYEFKGMRGKNMEQLLRDNPPENCTVYF